MTDLIKALRERRGELRKELQEHPAFQEHDLVCRLLERREASVSKLADCRPDPYYPAASGSAAVLGTAHIFQ
jgi:hypothetical protein